MTFQVSNSNDNYNDEFQAINELVSFLLYKHQCCEKRLV
jgi:hypothetical protein